MVIGLNDFALGIFKKKLLSIWEFSPIQIEEFEIKNKANFVFIFLKKWNELEKLPGIEEIVPDHLSLVKNLSLKNSTQYRRFYFDEKGGINFCVFFVSIKKDIDEFSFEELIVQVLIKSTLLWSDEMKSFKKFYYYSKTKGEFCFSSDFFSFLNACYDPILPIKSVDASHSLRLFARYKLNMVN